MTHSQAVRIYPLFLSVLIINQLINQLMNGIIGYHLSPAVRQLQLSGGSPVTLPERRTAATISETSVMTPW